MASGRVARASARSKLALDDDLGLVPLMLCCGERCQWTQHNTRCVRRRLVQQRVDCAPSWQRGKSGFSSKQGAGAGCFAWNRAVRGRLQCREVSETYIHKLAQPWSSGMMLACHAGDPGSIPGGCTLLMDLPGGSQAKVRYHRLRSFSRTHTHDSSTANDR